MKALAKGNSAEIFQYDDNLIFSEIESGLEGETIMGLFRKKELSEVEKEYYAEFRSEEQELIVLVKEACTGALIKGDFYTPSVRFIAAIDPESNELIQEEGVLSWIIPRKPKKRGWGHPFKKMHIYKVCVRKCYEKELEKYQSKLVNRRFFVVKILKHIKSEPRLDVIRNEYLKPVYIEDEVLGRFTLDRTYGVFEGNIDWMGNELSVRLNVDIDNDSTAKCAFDTLKRVYGDMQDWDERIRKYAAAELTGLANDWNEESSEDEDDNGGKKITEEDFAKRIGICSLNFDADGSIEIPFYDDDMFFGHWVVVHIDEHGAFERADIEG